ncbi:MAG TPA: hypothetical protein VFY87_09345 [Geminicoccaceae bacterium]|nr:hypothetical protein [Geminicoccaceae bacterium]
MQRRILLSGAVALAGVSILPPTANAAAGGLLINGVRGLARRNSTTYNSTFQGTITITKLAYDGQLKMSGLISGTVIGVQGRTNVSNQKFEQYATLTDPAGANSAVAQAVCSILELDIGPIHLDLLGLVIDLAAIHLDITAIPGGGLLGDLLCALAGLLDGINLCNVLEDILNAILDLINRINVILATL